jgi:serine/threonine-protein kinase
MDWERWQQIKGLFAAALELPAQEREAFLENACGADAELRREVEKLLASFARAESFMERPAVGEVASLIVEPNDKLRSGQRVAHYEIIRQLGAGGMGEVYLARDTRLNRKVALKVLPAHLTADKARLERFKQEARAASALNHPGIITIHEIDAEGETPFITTEYIEGETLRQRMLRGALHTAEALDVTAQLASALAVAHAAGVVHRDIKPENVMLRPDGIVKLLDFGLAKLTETGTREMRSDISTRKLTGPGVILGTVSYMSPEQAQGAKVDQRTDLWSLGVVLYEMLAGAAPFSGKTANHTLVAIMEHEPPLADVSPELANLVLTLLAKEPPNRYQTAQAVLADVRALQLGVLPAGDKPHAGKAKVTQSPARGEAAKTAGEKSFVETQTAAMQTPTADLGIAHPTSSAEYLVTEIKRHKRSALVALAAFVLLLSGGLTTYFYRAHRQPKISSLAVLPFQNASGEANLEYLSDGMSESLINKFAQIGQLRVIAQSSAFRFKGKEVDPKQAGQTLGVEALLTGKITKLAGRLSIGVELVDARDGTIIWNEQYNLDAPDEAVDEAQYVQNRIAVQTVKNLKINLTDIQDKQLTKYATQNAQAYQLYLNAMLLRRKSFSTETVKKSIDYYNQATALDPNFALAYAALANSYRFLAGSTNAEISSYANRKEINEKMYQAIARAQALDPTLPEVYTTLGAIKINELDFPAAERAYQHALELNPNGRGAHASYAFFLMIAGRHDEALTQIRLAEQLDPLAFDIKISEGRVLLAARRYDEAIPFWQNLAKTPPDSPMIHFTLAQAYTFKGMHREALAEHEKIKALQGKYTDEFYLFALAKAGKLTEARQELERLKKRASYSPAEFAVAYVALGEKEQALALLEKAFAERDPQLQFINIESSYDELRAEPRFQALLRRMNFP